MNNVNSVFIPNMVNKLPPNLFQDVNVGCFLKIKFNEV